MLCGGGNMSRYMTNAAAKTIGKKKRTGIKQSMLNTAEIIPTTI
jgi:hypothetical protein